MFILLKVEGYPTLQEDYSKSLVRWVDFPLLERLRNLSLARCAGPAWKYAQVETQFGKSPIFVLLQNQVNKVEGLKQHTGLYAFLHGSSPTFYSLEHSLASMANHMARPAHYLEYKANCTTPPLN